MQTTCSWLYANDDPVHGTPDARRFEAALKRLVASGKLRASRRSDGVMYSDPTTPECYFCYTRTFDMQHVGQMGKYNACRSCYYKLPYNDRHGY